MSCDYEYIKDDYDDYFDRTVEVYKCKKCGHIWHKIKMEEQE